MSLSFTEEQQPLVIRKWPPYPSFEEVSALRRERIALVVALARKNTEYVDNYLSTVDMSDKTLFWLQTMAAVCWPAREHLKYAMLPRDLLYKRMKDEGYDDEVIKQYMGEMI